MLREAHHLLEVVPRKYSNFERSKGSDLVSAVNTGAPGVGEVGLSISGRGIVTMYQYEAVEEVMRENGGYGTLKHLYEHAPRVEGSEWGTKTPNASIRRVVQRRDQFFKIRPGLWALEEYSNNLPEHVYADSASEEQKEEYSHWYFQGLLTEVGNSRKADTWVPSQDKNREFLDKTLGEVSSLESIPEFGYEEMVQRASTVDIIWFNERRMPDCLIEVEFSTDFQNSIHKFLDLQDYYANFVIAADSSRKSQFDKRLSQTGFGPIRNRVKFLSFDEVSTLHSATTEANQLSKRLAL